MSISWCEIPTHEYIKEARKSMKIFSDIVRNEEPANIGSRMKEMFAPPKEIIEKYEKILERANRNMKATNARGFIQQVGYCH